MQLLQWDQWKLIPYPGAISVRRVLKFRAQIVQQVLSCHPMESTHTNDEPYSTWACPGAIAVCVPVPSIVKHKRGFIWHSMHHNSYLLEYRSRGEHGCERILSCLPGQKLTIPAEIEHSVSISSAPLDSGTGEAPVGSTRHDCCHSVQREIPQFPVGTWAGRSAGL